MQLQPCAHCTCICHVYTYIAYIKLNMNVSIDGSLWSQIYVCELSNTSIINITATEQLNVNTALMQRSFEDVIQLLRIIGTYLL